MRHPLDQDIERGQLTVAAGEFRRALPGAGGKRVTYWIHSRTVSRFLGRVR